MSYKVVVLPAELWFGVSGNEVKAADTYMVGVQLDSTTELNNLFPWNNQTQSVWKYQKAAGGASQYSTFVNEDLPKTILSRIMPYTYMVKAKPSEAQSGTGYNLWNDLNGYLGSTPILYSGTTTTGNLSYHIIKPSVIERLSFTISSTIGSTINASLSLIDYGNSQTGFSSNFRFPVYCKDEPLQNGRRVYRTVNLYLSYARRNGAYQAEVQMSTSAAINDEYDILSYNGWDPVVPQDPYHPLSGPGMPYSDPSPDGGGGNFDNESDPIPEATTPTISAVDCGFVTLYNPTISQLNSLSAYLWSPLFTVDTLKKLFADPMDIILGLMIVPVDVPSSGTREVTVGGFSTGVTMNVAADQYIEKDCGSVSIAPFFGSYLDYAPYTKIQLFLPFIGTVNLNPDEIVGRTINIKYIVDIATGACTALVRLENATGRAAASDISGPLYTFAGQCCQPVPVTGTNWNQLISSVVQVATTAISAGSGAIGAAYAATQATQIGADFQAEYAGLQIGDTTMESMHQVKGFKPVDYVRETSMDIIPEDILPHAGVEHTPEPIGNISSELPISKITPLGLTGAAGTIAGLVNSVMSSKPTIGHSGSLSSVSGMIGIKTPYLIITRPRLTLAESYQELHGYPANSTVNFSDLQGFTKIESCKLTNMSCLTPELNEIYSWLKEGVVFPYAE